jgi:hypothetical protein
LNRIVIKIPGIRKIVETTSTQRNFPEIATPVAKLVNMIPYAAIKGTKKINIAAAYIAVSTKKLITNFGDLSLLVRSLNVKGSLRTIIKDIDNNDKPTNPQIRYPNGPRILIPITSIEALIAKA